MTAMALVDDVTGAWSNVVQLTWERKSGGWRTNDGRYELENAGDWWNVKVDGKTTTSCGTRADAKKWCAADAGQRLVEAMESELPGFRPLFDKLRMFDHAVGTYKVAISGKKHLIHVIRYARGIIGVELRIDLIVRQRGAASNAHEAAFLIASWITPTYAGRVVWEQGD